MTTDWIRKSQAGDLDAFTALFEQYKNLVYHTAHLILGDASEAEDALQEVFVQLHRTLGSYQPEKAAFTTWLYRITTHHCLNRRRKRLFSLVPLDSSQLDRLAPRGRRIEERQSELTEVRQALLRLTPEMRAVVVLRYFHDMGYAEIAQVLEIPLGTVQSRLSRALERMRETLAGADDERMKDAVKEAQHEL